MGNRPKKLTVDQFKSLLPLVKLINSAFSDAYGDGNGLDNAQNIAQQRKSATKKIPMGATNAYFVGYLCDSFSQAQYKKPHELSSIRAVLEGIKPVMDELSKIDLSIFRKPQEIEQQIKEIKISNKFDADAIDARFWPNFFKNSMTPVDGLATQIQNELIDGVLSPEFIRTQTSDILEDIFHKAKNVSSVGNKEEFFIKGVKNVFGSENLSDKELTGFYQQLVAAKNKAEERGIFQKIADFVLDAIGLKSEVTVEKEKIIGTHVDKLLQSQSSQSQGPTKG